MLSRIGDELFGVDAYPDIRVSRTEAGDVYYAGAKILKLLLQSPVRAAIFRSMLSHRQDW